MRSSRSVLFTALLTLFAVSNVGGQTARVIAQRTFPAVVLLVMEDDKGQPLSLGSGFFVQKGIVATNLHVIRGASRGYARPVGQKMKHSISGVVCSDETHDLALLAVTGSTAPHLFLADTADLAVGDEVFAVGNPEGLEGTFSQGIVSGIRQVGSDTVFQITAPISPGSSGGPVLNSQGNVIGVAAATFSNGQNLNFAIPASYLAKLMHLIAPARPLSSGSVSTDKRSILSEIGSPGVEGVTTGQFKWGEVFRSYNGYHIRFSFSILNRLMSPVRDTRCLLVFYDESGEPIDFIHAATGQHVVIPPGLAHRYVGDIEYSVYELSTKPLPHGKARVEITVLDFRIGR